MNTIHRTVKMQWMALALMATLFWGCPGPDPDPEPTQLELKVQTIWGNAGEVSLGNIFPGNDGRHYKIDVLLYYMTDLRLVRNDQTEVPLADVVLIDLFRPDSQTLLFELEPGTYTGLRFGLGIDSVRNHTDPSDYPASHPMSTLNGMFWTWNTQYIFFSLEGKADTTGTGTAPTEDFLYHTGTDPLFREVELSGLNIVVAEEAVSAGEIYLDLEQVLLPSADPINTVADPITHTTDEMALAIRIANNSAAAFRK